jgi:hypothetical protein
MPKEDNKRALLMNSHILRLTDHLVAITGRTPCSNTPDITQYRHVTDGYNSCQKHLPNYSK